MGPNATQVLLERNARPGPLGAGLRVEKLRFNRRNACQVLYRKIEQHNKAHAGRGLKFLRSFLSNVVRDQRYAAAKPLLDAVNGSNPSDSVAIAKTLLTQMYEDAADCFAASQIALTVKKYPFEGLPEIARANGITKFLNGERRNRHMNSLFRARRKAGNDDFFMRRIRFHVAQILGDKPTFQKWPEWCKWGPGASVGVHGQFTNFARKLLAERWTVTPTALPYALTLAKRLPFFWEALGLQRGVHNSNVVCLDFEEFEVRFMARVEVVQHNKLACVPKDADEDRIIAAEPLLNQLCQMAAEAEMKLKLRRFGIDLRDQSLNQVYAREGSLGGYNPRCTVDLRNASGSIFIELVREATLDCADWFTCLNAIRSPAYVNPFDTEGSDDKTTRYHMFSSMGNGFTFPLETIIFASICLTAHDYCGTAPDYRCYGDDLIVRQNEALVVLEILRHCGFKANADKTFIFGPFRESCGADWYSGTAVRPIVFDTPLEKLEERIRIHNALARLPNAQDAQYLSGCCAAWFPPFIGDFVRPFADHTDEAVDGRWIAGPQPSNAFKCTTFDAPAWYGLIFKSTPDLEVVEHPGYLGALLYAGVNGATSTTPFAARRETSMRVARFSHSGNTSSWVPDPLHRYLSCKLPRTRLLWRLLASWRSLAKNSASFGMTP